MNFIKSFYRENRKLFSSVVLVWMCASLAGIVYASKIEGESFSALSKIISDSFSEAPDIGKMIGQSFASKMELLTGVIIASTTPAFSPLIYFLSAFCGFSTGVSCALVIRMYSLKGALVNLTIHILPLSLSLPLYFMLFVSGLKFSFIPRKLILTEKVSERRRQWVSYILLQSAITLCIFMINVTETFLCRNIITFLN